MRRLAAILALLTMPGSLLGQGIIMGNYRKVFLGIGCTPSSAFVVANTLQNVVAPPHCSTTLTVTAGDKVLMFAGPATSTTPTVVDPLGNVWTNLGSSTLSGATEVVFISSITVSGSDAVNVDHMATVSNCTLVEYVASALDAGPVFTGGASTLSTYPTGPVTSTVPSDIILTVVFGTGNNTSATAPAGYHLDYNGENQSGFGAPLDFQIASCKAGAAGSYGTTWPKRTGSSSAGWQGVQFALKP